VSPAPTVTAGRLAGALGLRLRADHDRLEIVLGNAVIDVVAGEAGSAGGNSGERLALVEAPSPWSRPASATEDGIQPLRLAAVAIATVEAERFASDRRLQLIPLHADRALGATCWFVPGATPIVLLEPNSEGRIAASLARFGEGPAAIYLSKGVDGAWREGRAAVRGPFGREYVVPGWPAWGPHVVVCEFAERPPGTIDS
jgi:hypothetical protein